MLSELKIRITQSLAQVEIHGLNNFLKNDNWMLKSVWLILLLLASSYTSYSIYGLIADFLAHEVVSLTRVDYLESVDLPVIMLCNMNAFTTRFAKDTITSLQNGQILMQEPNYSRKVEYMMARYYVSLNAWADLNESVTVKFGGDLNTTVLSCVINLSDCKMESDFVTHYDPFFGNCFKFNTERTKKISFSGSMNGFSLELFSDLVEDDNSLLSIAAGFTVYLADQSSINTMYTNGINAPTGFLTDIVLRKYAVSKQPQPYSECIQVCCFIHCNECLRKD
jgi:hypothetical protein